MRLYNKSDVIVRERYDGNDFEFAPKTMIHVTDYGLGMGLVRKNPNLVDFDVFQKDLDEAKSPEEREAMLAPVRATFELPPDEAAHTTWLERARLLGLRGFGRNTDKAMIIAAVKSAIGKKPGPAIPEEPEPQRVRILAENSKAE